MRRKLIATSLVLACCVLALAGWSQRFELRAMVSEMTWQNRATYTGSGSKTTDGGTVVEWYEVDSRLLDRKLGQVAFVPEGGAADRPLLVFLHGRGGHPGGYLEQAEAAFDELGSRAPVVVQISGGDSSYYHDRDDGPWGRHVMEEAIPEAARRFDVDKSRIAIGGISMGGFGAFDLARLHPERFCAVGGHSAAMWTSAGQTPPGAYDDADDFARHDIVRIARERPRAWSGMDVWIDSGADDPFRVTNTTFADALRAGGINVSARTWPGGHSGSYWREHFGAYMRFYAKALADC